MKNRIILNKLQKQKKSKLGRIIVLTGARQTGKTTICKSCLPDYKYFAIDNPIESSALLKLTSEQWAITNPMAILDEIQKEPKLINSIKATYDNYDNCRYILLGSSQLLLMEKVKESLAGRCIINELFPLTLSELITNSFDDKIENSFFVDYILAHRQLKTLLPNFVLDEQYAKKKQVYEHYLNWGAFPALTDPELTDDERNLWLANYVKTYLERDVRDLASFRDLEPFIKLQRYIALYTGKIANYSDIAKETGVTLPTVQRYIRYLELSYQAFILPAWNSNSLKRLTKSPKIHLLDNGILRAILQKKGMISGDEYESAIVAEIYKQIKVNDLPLQCFHLRTQDDREVDLILEAEDYFIAIEIKMSENINKTDARHLRSLQDLLNKPLKHSFILSNDLETKKISDNITAVNAACFLT